MKNIKLKVLLLVAVCGIFGAMFGQSAWAAAKEYTFVYPRPPEAAQYKITISLELPYSDRNTVRITCGTGNANGENTQVPVTITQLQGSTKVEKSITVKARECGRVKTAFEQELASLNGAASGSSNNGGTGSGNTGGSTGGNTGGSTGGSTGGGTDTGSTGDGPVNQKTHADGATILTSCWNKAEGGGNGEGIVCILTMVVDVLTVGIGVLGVLGITVVGIQYLTAGGSEEQTRKAKRRLFEIIIGLVGYVLIYALLKFLMPSF